MLVFPLRRGGVALHLEEKNSENIKLKLGLNAFWTEVASPKSGIMTVPAGN